MDHDKSRELANQYLQASLERVDRRMEDDADWLRLRRVITGLQMQWAWQFYPLLPYPLYLKTDHWSKTRSEARDRAGNRCQVCNAGDCENHVHHRTYENLGREEHSDLIVLCKECHTMFHENGKLAE